MADQLTDDLASLKIDRDATQPRRGRVKVLLGLLALVLLGLATYTYGLPYLEAKVFKTEVAVTEVARVSPAQASIELTSSGYVVAQRVSNVAPKVPGTVTAVHVAQGEQVQAGDILFELDPADQKAAIAAARSQTAAARALTERTRADLAEAEIVLRREQALAKEGISPQGRADDMQARVASLKQAVKAAQAQAAAAQAQVGALEVNLKNLTLIAPIGGRILNKPPEVGEFVGPQPAGISIDMGGVEIADFATLTVETDVPEARLHLVKVGSPAEISLDAFPQRRFRGQTLEVTPKVNRAKATVTVKVSFSDEAEGVLPDMAARVSFLSEKLDESAVRQPPKTIVDASAISERSGTKVVFVVEDGKVRMQPVELGEPFGSGFEVKRGCEPGTKVVKNPPQELADGQRVKEASES